MAVTKAAEAFRTISEVADELDVPKHVLRFWEGRFPQLRPMKRGGGRRYYRPEDVELLRGIRRLLHEEGYTIKGVQKLIRDHGIDYVKTRPEDDEVEAVAPARRVSAAAPSEAAKLVRGRNRPRTVVAPLEASLRREAEAALAKLVAARKRIEALKL